MGRFSCAFDTTATTLGAWLRDHAVHADSDSTMTALDAWPWGQYRANPSPDRTRATGAVR
ncbi:hypothetical protein Nmn1133_05000 [Halosegnis longus]|uniref:Uncharacterized protein n=1 Tax=Halosegnis longus TaxID=2216012 RepID=A0AAJ4R892_9EURY|nr:hypothetical protein Nmn1133_05000 [Salella cibi]